MVVGLTCYLQTLSIAKKNKNPDAVSSCLRDASSVLLSFAKKKKLPICLDSVTCPPPTQWKVCIINTEAREQKERESV